MTAVILHHPRVITVMKGGMVILLHQLESVLSSKTRLILWAKWSE